MSIISVNFQLSITLVYIRLFKLLNLFYLSKQLSVINSFDCLSCIFETCLGVDTPFDLNIIFERKFNSGLGPSDRLKIVCKCIMCLESVWESL